MTTEDGLPLVLTTSLSSAMIRSGSWPRDDDGHRPLAPVGVRDADHRGFHDGFVPAKDLLELERRNPFAAGLDHVLDPIGDHQIAVPIDGPDVLGMEIAAGPQGRGCLLVVVVAAGDPGRA